MNDEQGSDAASACPDRGGVAAGGVGAAQRLPTQEIIEFRWEGDFLIPIRRLAEAQARLMKRLAHARTAFEIRSAHEKLRKFAADIETLSGEFQ